MAKIVRAREHFDALDGAIQTYLESCRDRAQLPTKINPHKNTIRITFEPMDPPTLLVSMIVGDFLHNTRSSLDHLWKRLGGNGNFPTFADTHSINNWLAKRTDLLNGVPIGAHAIIDALQPCQMGKLAPTHPLAILNALSNFDKHEALHLTQPRSKDTVFTFREKGSLIDVCSVKPPVVFHDQTELIITGVPEGRVKPNMDVNIKGFMFVSFKEPGPWGDEDVRKVLGGLLNFVKLSVIDSLDPFTQ